MCDASCRTVAGPTRPTVCIVSGSFGEGHDAAAREIQRRLRDHGVDAVIVDIVHRYPLHLGSLVKHIYLWQMKHLPRTWRWILSHLDTDAPTPTPTDPAAGNVVRERAPGHRVGRDWARRAAVRCVGLAARRLRELPSTFDAIVSTHPFASQAIGRLAAQGRMTGTASLTYLTDLSVHPLWVNPSVQRHLALHEVAARDAARLGAHDIRIVRPAVRRLRSTGPLAHEAPHSLDARPARVALGLPPTGQLALITGGAEGIGDLEAAALDLLEATDLIPVVLCARNEALRRRLLRHPGVTALGWVSDMPSLYAHVDVVVQNAGGSTSLEAIAAGVPMISYRCLPGHGETNAGNLERAGLVPWVRTRDDLAPALATLDGRRPDRWAGDCVANVIAETLAAG